jgi:TIGR03009 family protein
MSLLARPACPLVCAAVGAAMCFCFGAQSAAQQQTIPGQQALSPLPSAQQPSAPPPQPPAGTAPAQPAAAVQTPAEFQLNQLEQAYLDQVLATWEQKSAAITTFKCPFQRWDYNTAFGPAANIPLNKDKGELSYHKPDKGSFQITEINKWQAQPVQPGEQPPAEVKGDWIKQPEAIGEHWVCDGAAVFEYRHDQKQLVERPIPKEMQGKAIVDGPLPFLFGAEAAKLKARYWMRIQPQADPNQIWLVAQPKFQADAANYKMVELMLDRQQLLPSAMRVHLPNGSSHLYLFNLKEATVNGRLDRLMAMFQAPRTPLGYKRVVEAMPADPAAPGQEQQRQAAQPGDTGEEAR